MNLSGRLQDEPLPLILHQIHLEKATGVLRIETRLGKHEVFSRDGFPVSVRLPGQAEQIGKVLLEMGIIDEETHKRTVATPPPPGMRYGEWLAEKGMVTPEHLKLALKAQVRRKLHRLFFLADGQFKFEAVTHHEGMEKEEPLKIHPSRAIYQGVRSAWNAERLQGALFLLEGKAIKINVDDAAIARYGVAQEDLKITDNLKKGHWTVADLVEAVGMQPQPVHALVYALYITDGLDIQPADSVTRLRRRSDTSGAAPLPVKPASSTSQPSMSPLNPAILPAAKSSISQPRVQPFNPTLLPPNASAPSGKVPIPGTPPKGITQPLTLTPSGGVPSGPQTVDSIRKEIEQKAKVVEQENLFSVLGLDGNATRDQVKTAYFEAAKKYHPDRLTSMGLEALRPDVEKIFRRVSEAYGTLFDDARREEYKRTMGKPTGESPEAHAKAMAVLEAEMAFRRGEMLLRKNDYVGAVRELEAAVSGNPQEGEHLALLTWARVCAAQMTWTDAKPRLTEAVKLSPRCARAHYYLGLAFKEEGHNDRALGAFKKAVELDQRLLDAEREIRLMNMRRDKDKNNKPGLFDRFRKK